MFKGRARRGCFFGFELEWRLGVLGVGEGRAIRADGLVAVGYEGNFELAPEKRILCRRLNSRKDTT